MRIAMDAMGGDHAPEVNVKGAMLAAKDWTDIEIILVGDEKQIKPLLDESISNIKIHHTDEMILADEEPVKAVRRKKNSSMVLAGKMVKDKSADAMISAGNTGALMTTGLLVIGRIPGVERPALAPTMPTMDNAGILALDLGANMDASEEHLVQYAVMGSIYRSKIHGMESPRVGLLNVGTEAGKGSEITKAVYPMLEQLPINFIGNVEARDVLNRNCDVLVCDGFVGNILLKAMEGTANNIFSVLKVELTKNFLRKAAAAILKPSLSAFKKKMDYTTYGGAPLLGVNGVCIKSHGSSDANAVKNAVGQARNAIQKELVTSIASEFNKK
ncbi:phosphate acyltransferase PlsX [Chengkuizengella axinellae]|uniref:Phosphate acyltransferase n=1 Tax=Chengkuizengella axinellae TaxID=3064388 RepID=A0ABT9IVP8_9BACL|nr:phosphate acyltransferase PlsX [Chengkuizengella sp. 2205SS18-9]MDP5273402.1 phosphate acyltransferase PlsX [Chengkuizengella sp. 2205SS18-9]